MALSADFPFHPPAGTMLARRAGDALSAGGVAYDAALKCHLERAQGSAISHLLPDLQHLFGAQARLVAYARRHLANGESVDDLPPRYRRAIDDDERRTLGEANWRRIVAQHANSAAVQGRDEVDAAPIVAWKGKASTH